MEEERIMAIVNPVSANGRTGKNWPGFEERFIEAGIMLDVFYTEYPFHAMQIAAEGVKEGYRRIMTVGGDGTTNEVVNGLFSKGELLNPDLQLIIFSQGTGSDLIKTLGISNRIEDLIVIIKEGRVRLIDLGLVTYVSHRRKREGRYFVNLADLGIGAETAYLVNHSSKVLGGFLSYLSGALRTILKYKNKEIKLVIDGEEYVNEQINSVMVANGEYFGGGIKIAPGAHLDNGYFKIIILGDLTKGQILFNLARAYQGKHVYHPKVSQMGGQTIAVSSPDKVLLEIDGETVGYLPASFEILARRLPVLVNTEE